MLSSHHEQSFVFCFLAIAFPFASSQISCREWKVKQLQILALGVINSTTLLILDANFTCFVVDQKGFSNTLYTDNPYNKPSITLRSTEMMHLKSAAKFMSSTNLQAAPVQVAGVTYFAFVKSTSSTSDLLFLPLNRSNATPIQAKKGFWSYGVRIIAFDEEAKLMQIDAKQLIEVQVIDESQQGNPRYFRIKREFDFIKFSPKHSIDAGFILSELAVLYLASNAEQMVYVYVQNSTNYHVNLLQKVPYDQFFVCHQGSFRGVAKFLFENVNNFYIIFATFVMLIICAVVIYVKMKTVKHVKSNNKPTGGFKTQTFWQRTPQKAADVDSQASKSTASSLDTKLKVNKQ